MTATTLIPERISKIAGPRLSAVLTPIHDAWMADADRFLIPVTDSNATFWDRWAAVRYAGDLFQDRLRLEKAFLREVRPFLTPKLNARLWMQVDRIERLHGDLVHLAYQRGTARELAHSARQLLEAVRLWYAEFEFALSGTREEDLGKRAAQPLAELRKGRRFELCDLCEV